MAASYPYLGSAVLGYPDYADEETGQMLVAEPGGSYAIRAVDGERKVPPPDGNWGTPGGRKTAEKQEAAPAQQDTGSDA